MIYVIGQTMFSLLFQFIQQSVILRYWSFSYDKVELFDWPHFLLFCWQTYQEVMKTINLVMRFHISLKTIYCTLCSLPLYPSDQTYPPDREIANTQTVLRMHIDTVTAIQS